MIALAIITQTDQDDDAQKKGRFERELKTLLASMKQQPRTGSLIIHSLVGNISPNAQF